MKMYVIYYLANPVVIVSSANSLPYLSDEHQIKYSTVALSSVLQSRSVFGRVQTKV